MATTVDRVAIDSRTVNAPMSLASGGQRHEE
jgi:hypothetical protein